MTRQDPDEEVGGLERRKVWMVRVGIPMIRSTSATRCSIISSDSQCLSRTYRSLVSRAEPRALSRNRIIRHPTRALAKLAELWQL